MSNIQSRNIKDISDDVERFKDKISENKDEVKSKIDSLNTILDDSVKNADYQIKGIISELNFKNKKNQDKYNSNIESAATHLEDSIRILKDDISEVKSAYKKSLILLCVSFVLLLSHSILIPIYPSINITIYSIPITQISITVIVLLILLNIYRNANIKIKLDLTKLDENKSSLKSSEMPPIESNIPIQKFGSVKPHLTSIKDVLSSFVLIAGDTVPLVKQVYGEINLLVKYEQSVNNFIAAMEYYNLTNNVEYFNQISGQVPPDVRLKNDKNIWEGIIAEKISKKIKQDGIEVSEDIILLLYYEHNGLNTKSLFRKIRDSNSELGCLAQVLISSNKLVDMPNLTNHNQKDIVAILAIIDIFAISEINKILSKSIRLLDYLHAYVEFLEINKINVHFIPDIAFTITETDGIGDKFEEQVMALSYKIGKKVLSENSNLGKFLDGFVRASLSIKFHDEHSLCEIACKYSGNDISTAIIKSYYDKNKEDGRQNVVYLTELIDDYDLIEQNMNNTNGKDFLFLKAQLKEGKWLGGSVSLMVGLLEKLSQEMRDQFSEYENYTIFKEVIKDVFSRVKLGTIDKAIDSQIFGAYLIMGKNGKGPMLDLVDKLSILDSGNNRPEKRWRKKTPSQIEEMYNEYKIKPKYNFINFSNNTRIGILPKGQSFIDFKHRFLDDLETVLRETSEVLESGIILQRISPSKYSFGILEDNQLPMNINIKNLDVAEYVTKLVSDYVPMEEQMVIGGLDKDINLLEIIGMRSMSDLIRQEKDDDLKEEEIELLDSSQFKFDLMNEIEKLGVNNLKSLSIDLHNKIIDRGDASLIIKRVILKHYSNTKGLKNAANPRSKVLSERFSLVLDNLGLVYEWYSN